MQDDIFIGDYLISSHEGQQNADVTSNTVNDRIKDIVLQDTESGGRHFLDGKHSLFGYNGVVVTGGKIVSLISVDKDEDLPPISLDGEVIIKGDSHGYVSSGHKEGDRVRVIGLIEPFFSVAEGVQSSDKIIQVDGAGVIGWIKPSEINREQLKQSREEMFQRLFKKQS